MEQLLLRLAKVKDQIKALKSQKEQLLNEHKKALSTIERLQKLVEIQNNSIRQLEQQLKVKRIADQLGNDASLSSNESRALKYKINEIIKEVDKVIALIHE